VYEYRCELRAVVDGDTVDVDIDLGFDCWLRKQRVRLSGINAPEIHTKDADEKARGLRARDRLRSLLEGPGRLTLQVQVYDATEKFGRILGRVVNVDGLDVASILLAEHLAVPYAGGAR
jgi:micrococcal nuclease